MAKNDRDLFDRLRQVGLRKRVAKTLSEIGEDANKKAVGAARSAVSELRSLADDLERRLPGAKPEARKIEKAARGTTSGPQPVAPLASESPAAPDLAPRPVARRESAPTAVASPKPATRAARATRPTPKPAVAAPKPAVAAPKPAATPEPAIARAPRGENKAKILKSLATGAKTASEIAKETGIGTGTVGTTLSKMAVSGEVVKAQRGYGLPKQR